MLSEEEILLGGSADCREVMSEVSSMGKNRGKVITKSLSFIVI